MTGIRFAAAGILTLVLLWAAFVALPRLTLLGGDALARARIQQLEADLSEVRRQLVVARGHGNVLAAAKTTITIDLVELLGYEHWLYGVSWAPKVCFPPFKTLFPKLSAAEVDGLEARYIAAMRRELAALLGVGEQDIDPALPYAKQPAVLADLARRRRQHGVPVGGGATGGVWHQRWLLDHGAGRGADAEGGDAVRGDAVGEEDAAGEVEKERGSVAAGYKGGGEAEPETGQWVDRQQAVQTGQSHQLGAGAQQVERQWQQQMADTASHMRYPHAVGSLLEAVHGNTGGPISHLDAGRALQQGTLASGTGGTASEAPQPGHAGRAVQAVTAPENVVMSPSELAADPVYLEWRKRLTLLNAAFLLEVDARLYVPCPKYNITRHISVAEYGTISCRGLVPDELIIDQMGYAFMPQHSMAHIALLLKKEGLCTCQPFNLRAGWGDWQAHERLGVDTWATFNTPTTNHDTVVALFDILYERLAAFKKQYFMGVITMQNPADMYTISDIIFTQKPDLIIETGTANGGSALMWAGIMELAGCPDSARVLTVDVVAPSWNPDKNNWGGVARDEPTKHPLWTKRVTFLKGMSTSTEVMAEVKKAASAAKRVLVLLDSDHSAANVRKEMGLYCTLVTPESYCIVQDTKMSRWGMDGPLLAVRLFLMREGKGEFEIDREREPLHTHHAQGYLKRTAPGKAAVQQVKGPTENEALELEKGLVNAG